MKIQRYNPSDMTLAEDDITGMSFGTVYQGNHCVDTLVLKPVLTTESSLNEMKVFLQNAGPYRTSSFGYLVSGVPVQGISPGSIYLSNHFTEDRHPALSGSLGASMMDGDYVWLDVQTGVFETGSYPGINYQFVFDYV